MTLVKVGRRVAYEICDFTIIQDTREQTPWTFRGYKCDAPYQDRDLVVPVKVAGLKTGDYSLEGFENKICIERKSLADLYSTLGSGRERFKAEFQRMQSYDYAAVVIEADWLQICADPPERSKLKPKCVMRTLLAWSQRYGVHIHAASCAGFAERLAFRLLQRYHLDGRRKNRVTKECGEVAEISCADSGESGHSD
jgi:ERCC4-type nuclease